MKPAPSRPAGRVAVDLEDMVGRRHVGDGKAVLVPAPAGQIRLRANHQHAVAGETQAVTVARRKPERACSRADRTIECSISVEIAADQMLVRPAIDRTVKSVRSAQPLPIAEPATICRKDRGYGYPLRADHAWSRSPLGSRKQGLTILAFRMVPKWRISMISMRDRPRSMRP